MTDSVAHALAGAAGGILSLSLTYPLITISTRAAVEANDGKPGFVSQIKGAKKIILKEGVQGLYR